MCSSDLNFQVPHGVIANLPKFSGYPHENAIAHVKSVLELCVTQNEQTVGIDTYRMRVFPLTLIDGEKGWLNQMPPNSVRSWEDYKINSSKSTFQRKNCEGKLIPSETGAICAVHF